ncbi:hypothetical protein [Nostoc favosum]|uniref:Uncharacterized protein n=1 Tax=Nostoc favosum CHAB5714 TaxID=2780399 RepID=A0ABS8I9B8_9NOSO|nr:hypothetical protein [Nostoc favosum]MCC5600284.1 hypothetical protein [Nostoc favosum CHAB5714]
MPTSSSNLWKTQIGSFELTAIYIDDSGEIMIRQEDFILKPANDASVVFRTQSFLGREYQSDFSRHVEKAILRVFQTLIFPLAIFINLKLLTIRL